MESPNDKLRAATGGPVPTDIEETGTNELVNAMPEVGQLNMAMNDSTDDVVALENASAAAAVSSRVIVDQEHMEVIDASDLSNLKVTRGANNSTAAAHDVGAQVLVY